MTVKSMFIDMTGNTAFLNTLVVCTYKIISLNVSTGRDPRRSSIELTFFSLQETETLRVCDLELNSKDINP